ncbi:hypothetical protein Scep_016009 [Stephania cephalantha]|uniref:Pentatricopeptide repeat-containing protein n=1 Tax=Stephania cephalantha TaxID=152367 RepID=A0AAP0INI1_9MAGN
MLHSLRLASPRAQVAIFRRTQTLVSASEEQIGNSELSELISKQHWRDLRSIVNRTSPEEFLQFLFESEAFDAETTLRYFRWSAKEFDVCYGVEFHCRLLNLLAMAKRYGEIRSLIDWFVKSRDESVSLVLHSIVSTSSSSRLKKRVCCDVIVDMLVLGYVKNSKVDFAVEAFERAGDYRFRLSRFSCNPLLNALVKQSRIENAEAVYKEMIRRRVSPDLITFNIMINGLCKAGRLQKAGDVMEDMKAWGVLPSVVTYNTLIDGYCKSGKAGKLYKADALLKEMISKNVHPNEVTFNIMIDGYCKDRDILSAKRLFKEIKDHPDLAPNVITYNSLINGLCQQGKLDEALSLRDEMLCMNLIPNVATNNALINGFCKKGMVKEARQLFDFIIEQGLSPNVISYNTLIDAYNKGGKMEEALKLHGLMMLDKNVCPDNVSTYNCLISGLCAEGNKKRVSEILDQMAEKGVRADDVTYNILISALCRKGESKKAMKLLDEMIDVGLKPRHLTYNILIDAFCGEGKLDAAFNMKMRMEKAGRRANIVTYNVLIKGLCKKGKLEEANGLLNEMLEKGLIPNQITYEIIREKMVEQGFVPDIDGHLYSGLTGPSGHSLGVIAALPCYYIEFEQDQHIKLGNDFDLASQHGGYCYRARGAASQPESDFISLVTTTYVLFGSFDKQQARPAPIMR